MLIEPDSDQHERDVDRLEAALADRAREVRELRSELDRRDVLIRDLSQRWDILAAGALVCAPTGGAESDVRHLEYERDAAIARAMDAEAASLEARFRIDELSGHLAVALARPTEDPACQERIAFLEGAFRGARARLAEAEDARDRADARLMLAEQDLSDALERAREAGRERAELAERLELETLRTHVTEGELARIQGERLGLIHRAREADTAVAALQAWANELQRRLEEAEHTLGVSLAERDAARVAIDAARGDLAARDAALASIRSEERAVQDTRVRAAHLRDALLEARQGLGELQAWLGGRGDVPVTTTAFEIDSPVSVGFTGVERDEPTQPSVPPHLQEAAAAEARAMDALAHRLAERDEQVRQLEAHLDEMRRRYGTD